MILWKYKYFVDVIDSKSFTKAGKKNFVSQTAISPVKVEALFLYEAKGDLFLKPITPSVKKESFVYAF